MTPELAFCLGFASCLVMVLAAIGSGFAVASLSTLARGRRDRVRILARTSDPRGPSAALFRPTGVEQSRTHALRLRHAGIGEVDEGTVCWVCGRSPGVGANERECPACAVRNVD